MSYRKNLVPWIAFTATMLAAYIFMMFFMEGLSAGLFEGDKKQLHIESAVEPLDTAHNKHEVIIDKASANYMKDTLFVMNGRATVARIDSGEPLTGLDLVSVEMFNNNRLLYSIIAILVMVATGSFVAYAADIILKKIGFSFSKIAHRE